MFASRKQGNRLRGAASAALLLALVPSLASTQPAHKKKPLVAAAPVDTSAIGSFTPAAADPRFASSFGRGGLASSGFRFTPSGGTRQVTVAVRARASTPVQTEHAALNGGFNPYAYNLGVAVGWKRFAILSDYSKVDLGAFPGSHESADVAVSYGGKRWSTRLALGADRSLSDVPRLVDDERGVSVDLGGSYSINNRIDVTGGVRYKVQHLQMIDDDRRDSQAIYVGTAFRF
jgi:hypothetical protein